MRQLKSKKILVIGTSGSGKTTLARNIANSLNIPHIEIDALNWGENWTEAPKSILLERVSAATQGETWVIDGNYSLVRKMLWEQVDTIIWLDYSFQLTLWRITCRTIGRAISREELWNGNRESLKKALFTKKSMIWWVITTYKRRKRDYIRMFDDPKYSDKIRVRLQSPQATELWLKSI